MKKMLTIYDIANLKKWPTRRIRKYAHEYEIYIYHEIDKKDQKTQLFKRRNFIIRDKLVNRIRQEYNKPPLNLVGQVINLMCGVTGKNVLQKDLLLTNAIEKNSLTDKELIDNVLAGIKSRKNLQGDSVAFTAKMKNFF